MPVGGDLCIMLGHNGSETIQEILMKVEHGTNLSAILTFVDYALKIYPHYGLGAAAPEYRRRLTGLSYAFRPPLGILGVRLYQSALDGNRLCF